MIKTETVKKNIKQSQEKIGPGCGIGWSQVPNRGCIQEADCFPQTPMKRRGEVTWVPGEGVLYEVTPRRENFSISFSILDWSKCRVKFRMEEINGHI